MKYLLFIFTLTAFGCASHEVKIELECKEIPHKGDVIYQCEPKKEKEEVK